MQATLYGTFGGSIFALEHDTRQCASDVQPRPTHTAGHCTSYYADVYRMRHVLTCGDTPLVQAPSSTTSVTATTEPLEAGPSSGAAHRKVISTLCMWTIPHVRDSIHHAINRSNNFTNNFSNGFGGAIRLGSPDGGKSTTYDICKLK